MPRVYLAWRDRPGSSTSRILPILTVDGVLVALRIDLPSERTEYYSPMTWLNSFDVAVDPQNGPMAEFLSMRTLKAGERTNMAWGKAAMGPATGGPVSKFNPSPHQVAREGDMINARLPLFSDSAGHTGFSSPEFGDTGDTVLYSGGKEIGRSGAPGRGTFPVPAGMANYRLTSVVNRNHPAWALSTKISAEWEFRSGHTTASTPLPLLTISFDPKLDLTNHAPAGGFMAIPVRVDRQPGTQGGKAEPRKVEVSYNDGQTCSECRR